ncbi:hypothetical protein GCM10017776_45950 [Streptomyces griseoluteus]|nr:hypothetical protein GCM10017776_45950 [Streptomyces griseoluteus]
MSAATPARATVAVRRRGERRLRAGLVRGLLLNTDSFCVAAGRAAEGDRTVGWGVRGRTGRCVLRVRARGGAGRVSAVRSL